MGWTWCQRNKYYEGDDFRYWSDKWNRDDEHVKQTVLRLAKRGATIYLAVEHIRKETNERTVWAGIVLTKWHSRDKDGYNFGYKDMDETCGPNEVDCPKYILDMLTPTDSEYANNWRAACRAKKTPKAPKLVIGQTIVTNQPLNFGKEYGNHSEFLVVSLKPLRFRLPTGGWVRLRKSTLANTDFWHVKEEPNKQADAPMNVTRDYSKV